MRVAIVGNRKAKLKDGLKEVIEKELTRLAESGYNTFIFCGARNYFDFLCYEAVEHLIKSHGVKRYVVRGYCECITEDYFNFFIEFSEDKYFGNKFRVQLSKENVLSMAAIIKSSDVLLTYYNSVNISNLPNRNFKKLPFAVRCAMLNKKKIINIYDLL